MWRGGGRPHRPPSPSSAAPPLQRGAPGGVGSQAGEGAGRAAPRPPPGPPPQPQRWPATRRERSPFPRAPRAAERGRGGRSSPHSRACSPVKTRGAGEAPCLERPGPGCGPPPALPTCDTASRARFPPVGRRKGQDPAAAEQRAASAARRPPGVRPAGRKAAPGRG